MNYLYEWNPYIPWINMKKFDEIMKKYNIQKLNGYNDEKYIDVIQLTEREYEATGERNKLLDVDTYLKTLIEEESLVRDKYNLYFSFKKIGKEKFLAESIDLKYLKQIDKDWILKPAGYEYHSGHDIFIVRDEEDLKKKKKYFKGKKVLASEYIKDISLYKGKKFHIRFFMLVNYKPFKCKIFNMGVLVVAKKEYDPQNITEKEVYDTHRNKDEKVVYYPDDTGGFLKNSFIYKQLRELEVCFEEILKGHVKPINSKYGYSIFGLDILVKKDGKLILMECDDNAGFMYGKKDLSQKNVQKFIKGYFKWLDKEVFSLVF